MTKIMLKPLHIFAEIRRVDEEARTFDAYAFVNEVVEGEGGIRLKRSAMEAATPDYMEWANIRRMHEADAVGVASNVVWDATGAMLTVAVHDDDAWNKVKNRVYKGLSVGVAATVMRGKDVEACRWFETSLVDRPKDPDAKILAFRAEGVTPGEEFEAEVEEPVLRSFNDWLEEIQEEDIRQDIYAAFSWLMDLCYGCMDNPALLAQNLDEFAAYCKTVIGGEAEPARAAVGKIIDRLKEAPAQVARLETLQTDHATVLSRAEAAETELARVQGALTERSAALASSEERVKVLEAMPTAAKPVRFPQALERTFTANEIAGVDPVKVGDLRAELTRLEIELKDEPDHRKRQDGVVRYMAIERELREIGA